MAAEAQAQTLNPWAAMIDLYDHVLSADKVRPVRVHVKGFTWELRPLSTATAEFVILPQQRVRASMNFVSWQIRVDGTDTVCAGEYHPRPRGSRARYKATTYLRGPYKDLRAFVRDLVTASVDLVTTNMRAGHGR